MEQVRSLHCWHQAQLQLYLQIGISVSHERQVMGSDDWVQGDGR